MEYLIFKTGITTQKKAQMVMSELEKQRAIHYWSIDTTDVDNVLRVEASEETTEKDIILRIQNLGFYCEVLTD